MGNVNELSGGIKVHYEIHFLAEAGEWQDFKGSKGFTFDNEAPARAVLDVMRTYSDDTWRLVKITKEIIG